MNPEQPICSAISLSLGEPLFASASYAEAWMMLEYQGARGEKAFEESSIPEQVKDHLSAALRSIVASRLLLIKRRSEDGEKGLRLFTAAARPIQPMMHSFRFEKYEDLLEFDLPGVLRGDPTYHPNRFHEPLFLVCTNGRRDPCCARFGVPFYSALLEMPGLQAWECSHVGGHRFAANALVFPHALFYGRLEPGEAQALVSGYQKGEINLAHYRGRACYPEPVQAAEFFLYQHSGRLGIEEWRWKGIEETGSQEWAVTFHSRNDESLKLRIGAQQSAHQYQQSCRSAKSSPLVSYHLLDVAEAVQP